MEAHLHMTGWAGTDVETRVTARAQASTASFRLACTPRLRRNGEWCDGDTTWITVTCYRTLADNVASSVTKGDPVLVSGRLRTNTWVDAEGQRQERLLLEASSVGHDLSRGTASFARNERPAAVEEGDDGLHQLLLSVEGGQSAGEQTAVLEGASATG